MINTQTAGRISIDKLSMNILEEELIKIASKKIESSVPIQNIVQYSIYDVAKYFITKDEKLSMTKLQKLVYYAYSWYLVHYNSNSRRFENKLFSEQIIAEADGPVFKCLSDASDQVEILNKSQHEIEGEARRLCDKVWEVYGCSTDNYLMNLTKKEKPWKNAKTRYDIGVNNERLISDIDVYNFYKS